jgi:uncharacterized RDD family membrane protein YckC
MSARNQVVVTPEAVPLVPDLAGLGSRMIAAIIDSLIQGVAVIGLSIAFFAAERPGTALLVAYLILIFALTWGYFPLFEGLWGGRTPGKRAQRLRVVGVDGQPATFGPIMIRNLLRLIDFLPGYYTIGAISILVTSRSQRLGDLAAGTVVIRERLAPVPTPLELGPPGPPPAPIDTTAITERQYEVVRSFLERRLTFTPEARSSLAADLASKLRPLTGPHGRGDEEFLEALFISYRDRHHSPSQGGRADPSLPAPPSTDQATIPPPPG